MGIIGYDDLAEYIRSHYPRGARIVEVGVGRHPDLALLLKDDYDLVCTDVTEVEIPGVRCVKDDIFHPDISVYRGAVLIYSIRPPVDMQDSLAAVARQLGSDLIIRPFSSEKADLKPRFRRFQCINYKRAVFFLYRP